VSLILIEAQRTGCKVVFAGSTVVRHPL